VPARYWTLADVRAQLDANRNEGSAERIGEAREARYRGGDDQRDEHNVLNETLSGLVGVKLLKPLNEVFH